MFARGANATVGGLNLSNAICKIFGTAAAAEELMTRRLEPDDAEDEVTCNEEDVVTGGSGCVDGAPIGAVDTGASDCAPGKVSRERMTPVKGGGK